MNKALKVTLIFVGLAGVAGLGIWLYNVEKEKNDEAAALEKLTPAAKQTRNISFS